MYVSRDEKDYLNNMTSKYLIKAFSTQEKNSDLIVYHYTSEDALNKMLQNKTLWFTNAYYLNDCTELNYFVNLVKELSDQLIYELPNDGISGLCKQTITLLLREIYRCLKNVFVFSTSLNNDSFTLWNAYGEYNLGLKPDLFPNHLRPDNYYKVKMKFKGKNKYNPVEMRDCFVFQDTVTYDPEKQKEEIREFITDLIGIYVECREDLSHYIDNGQVKIAVIDKINSIVKSMAQVLAIRAIFNKDAFFKEEQEYRIAIAFIETGNNPCKFDIVGTEEIINYRQKKKMQIPYLELCFERDAIAISNFPIKSITIDSRLGVDKVKMLHDLLDSLRHTALGIDKIEIILSKVPLRY
ncbi:hypothetical protein [Lactobacillus acetotolerans]|uniref:hypothetical protein n=1 Tax=Lactobacillus acetotolerans TaxID=1600 RepID=UPI00241E5AD6|nr:hypothetical protein [Lactobacillus acetotolerans]